MASFSLSILAADCPFYKGDCVSLVVPTPGGQYGILANHSNTISAIVPGILLFRTGEGEPMQAASVSEGLVKVEDNQVLVLVDTAEHPEGIDEKRALADMERAREAMLQKKSILEYRLAQANLARAVSRLQLKKKYDPKR